MKCPFRLDEKCIAVHVPQGEKLDFDKCVESFGEADAFFGKFFPRHGYRAYNIVSRLLNPELESVPGSGSDIVRFGKLFTLLGKVHDSDMNERRVFGYKKERGKYAPRNVLQQYALNRIKARKPLYSYSGYRKKAVSSADA